MLAGNIKECVCKQLLSLTQVSNSATTTKGWCLPVLECITEEISGERLKHTRNPGDG